MSALAPEKNNNIDSVASNGQGPRADHKVFGLESPRTSVLTRRRFAAALVLGLVIRAATLVLPGHEDVALWKVWSYAAAHDVLGMYGVGGSPPTRGVVAFRENTATVDYPPFFLYEYAIVGRIFGALFPTYPNNLALHIAVKLPALLANMALTAVFFLVARRVSGRPEPGRWAALAY